MISRELETEILRLYHAEGWRCYGQQWLRRTGRKFLASRLQQGDLTDLLWSPMRARWAAPKRLPYLQAS